MDTARVDRERLIARLVCDDRALQCASSWGLDLDAVRGVIRAGHIDLDAHTAEAGHPILRFTSGDVVVVVGLRDAQRPKVLHVHTRTGMATGPRVDAPAGSKRGGRAGSSLPTSQRDLKRRILGLGYRFEIAGSGHLAVIDKETDRRIATVSGTPRPGRGIADDWKRFLAAHDRNRGGSDV